MALVKEPVCFSASTDEIFESVHRPSTWESISLVVEQPLILLIFQRQDPSSINYHNGFLGAKDFGCLSFKKENGNR